MKQQISIGQYRAIDLGILAAFQIFAQVLMHLATTSWFPEQLYVVSPVAGMTAIVMMRWGVYGGIPGILGGLVFSILSGGKIEQILIYGIGNLAALGALGMVKCIGKERIRCNVVTSLIFGFITQLLMQLGRAVVAGCLGYSVEACVGFVTTDALSILFTLLIIWVARRVDGLFEDQKHYLLRIQSERQNEGRG